MDLFRKNKKLIAYLIIFLIVLVFIYVCFFQYNLFEGFTCDNVTSYDSNVKTSNIQDDVCFDCNTVLSNKNDTKFQYISCITEENHPTIEDVKVNIVVRNRDGTFFNVVSESIETNTQTNNESKTYNFIGDTEVSLKTNQQVPSNSQLKLGNNYNINIELKPLNTNETQDDTNVSSDSNLTTNDITSIFNNVSNDDNTNIYPSLDFDSKNSNLIFKTSSTDMYRIDYIIPKEIYTKLNVKVQDNKLNVIIQNDDLGENPYSQEFDLKTNENDYPDSTMFITSPSSSVYSVMIKNFTLETNKSNKSNNDTNPNLNHVMKMDLGECKYKLSDLDHILIEQLNVHNLENDILSKNKNWETLDPKGYVAGGIRNILYKDCDNNVVQNYNISSKLVRELSVYKNENDMLDLPSIYLIYNKDHYESEQQMIDYTRDFYEDKIIQVIGNFSYGVSKNDILSYDQMLKNSEYNEDNSKNSDIPACANTDVNPHGCCPDGVTPSEDVYGTNCAPLHCSFSQYGCCKDGVTTSMDLMGSNCPQI